MYDLNESQKIAADHFDGPMMVLAGPGSGKTSVITARSVIMAKKVDPRQILVITFSKSAANEMKRRFCEMFSNEPPPVVFGTFHSVFFRMLRESKNYNIDQLVNDGERRNVIKSYLARLKYALEEETVSSVINELSLIRNELIDLTHYHSKTIAADDFLKLDELYEQYKKENGKIDFDDMLTHAYNMLSSDSSELSKWQRRYAYMMVDEFQDINRVQYEAMNLLARPKNNIFIVGDDDQSIYRFRGSRPEFLLNFPKDFANTKHITLTTNYRSTDSIINYANNLISQNEVRYSKQIIGTGKKGPKPVILKSEDQNAEAIKIGELIRNMVKQGVALDEIAVAFRLNMQARAFIDAFLNMNIPFKSRDEIPILYNHWIAEDIYAYLRLAGRLRQKQSGGFDADAERIINKPFRFISKAFLAGLKKYNKNLFEEYWQDRDLHIASKTGIEELQTNLLVLAKLETADAIKFIRRQLGYNGHIVDISDYRKLNSKGLFEIADELTEAAKQFPSPEDFIAHGAMATEAAKNQPVTKDCCTLTTLHSAKGLEFEKVFIAGLVEDVLPHLHSKTPAEIEEERRLFYVGATRAKNELFLSVVKMRYDKPCNPSRFL